MDRTFNLKIDASVRILQFFLDRLSDDLFLHFEVIPDHLPDRLKAMIAQFLPGVLQFEVGIQSFNVEVQQRISRRQDNDKTEANLRWLVNESNAHLHTDLIFGLPGESLASFAQGFDRLYAIRPHEIQLGILKRLRGTPIARHTLEHGMVYESEPPYTVLQTHAVSRDEMQRFTRLARYWDLVANSGRFARTLAVLMPGPPAPSPMPLGEASPSSSPSPFWAFMAFSDWLWQTTGQTSGLTPEALVDALFDYLTQALAVPRLDATQDDAAWRNTVRQTLLADYLASGSRARPACLREVLPAQTAPMPRHKRALSERQDRHGSQAPAVIPA